MDGLSDISREAQIVRVGGVLLLILSFLHWQQVSAFGFTAGLNEWHGVGTLAALLVIAMLAWEVVRVASASTSLGTLSPGLVSVGLALLMALFTVVAFLDKGTARHWPAWIALIVALVVAWAAVLRARAEGVQLPTATPAGSAAPPEPVEPAAPAEQAPPAEPTEPLEDSSE